MVNLFSFVKECSGCKYQQSNFSSGISADIEGLTSLRTQNNKKIIGLLKKYVDLKDKEILDIGCSLGYLLDNLKENGIVATDLEPQVSKAKVAIQKGHNVTIGIFPRDIHKKYDILFFNDVFEHLDNIVEAKEAILKTLNPNGIVVFAVPNSKGIYYLLTKFLFKLGIKSSYERLWQKGFPSPHLSYFNNYNIQLFFQTEHILFSESLSGFTIQGLYKRLRATNGILLSLLYYVMGFFLAPFEALSKDNIVIAVKKK